MASNMLRMAVICDDLIHVYPNLVKNEPTFELFVEKRSAKKKAMEYSSMARITKLLLFTDN